jgi:hypothetical protein
VAFDVTDQLLSIFLCIRQTLAKKWEYNETVHQLFVDFKKDNDSVRREVLYQYSYRVWNPHEISQAH